MSAITEITSASALDSLKASLAPGQLLVLDFHATWCGPCKAIAPILSRMSNSYPDVLFAKIDVDVCRDLAREYRVSAMPTFKLLKRTGASSSSAAAPAEKGSVEVVDTIRGADARGLVALVARHSGRDANKPKPGEEVKVDDLEQTQPAIMKLFALAILAWVAWTWWNNNKNSF